MAKLNKSLVSTYTLERKHVSAGFSLHRFGVAELDPFIDITLFDMSEPTFPPHPHAGISAVTYMLPESPGCFINRGSIGDSSMIEPGAIHWAQAGSGLIHEEVPEFAGARCFGCHMFVKLRQEEELSEPRVYNAAVNHIPELEGAGWYARLLTGEVNNQHGALSIASHSVLLMDLFMEPHSTAELTLNPDYSIWALLHAGAFRFKETSSSAVSGLIWTRQGATLLITAGQRGARALMGGGVPLDQPFIFNGCFALSTTERIRDAKLRYQRGEMGELNPSF